MPPLTNAAQPRPLAMRGRIAGLAFVSLLSALHSGTVLAQSRYVATVLKPPFMGVARAPAYIDEQNRVVASVDYSAGGAFEINPIGLPMWVWKYASYPTIWKASTATSLASAKLLTARNLFVNGISPDGSKVALKLTTDNAALVYDTVTKKNLAYPGNGAQVALGKSTFAAAVNNAGWVAGHIDTTTPAYPPSPEEVRRATRWRAGQGGEQLELVAPFVGSKAVAINAGGEVVGEVYEPKGSGFMPRAAKWGLDGKLTVLDTTPSLQSSALAIANNGIVLMSKGYPFDNTTAHATLALHDGTSVQTLQPKAAGDWLVAYPGRSALSPKGDAVVGTVVAGDGSYAERAFIYKDGQMQDLTDYVSSKGAKLPAGNYVYQATAINDSGSMAGQALDANRNFSVVRLTGQP